MASKTLPAVRKFLVPQTSGTGLRVTRVARELSGQNRRLYRQSRVYRCKVNIPGGDKGTLHVYKLRDSFMLQRAYGLAMQAWNESHEDAMAVVKKNVRARWRDFRIELKSHISDTLTDSVTLSGSGTGVTITPVVVDEYDLAFATQTDGTTRDFALRSDVNTYDIIAEYNKEGKVQDSPNTTTVEAAYEELQADLQNDDVLNIQASGNEPPYDGDSTLPGEILEYVGTLYNDASGRQKLTTGYFDAPLGAIFTVSEGFTIPQVKYADGTLAVFDCEIEVQGGDYKGIKAHPFVDAKALGSGN